MICFNCKKQIPDNAPNCPNCGAPIVPQVQIGQEIKVRRWQRWIFYVIFIVLFLASLAFALYVYSENTALLQSTSGLNSSLAKTQGDLATAQSSLSSKDSQLQQAQGQLTQSQQDAAAKQTQLDQKTQELQQVSQQKDNLTKEYDKFQTVLSAVNANTFNLIVQMGIGISNNDLSKIPVADYNLSAGTDSDSDGLSDTLEQSFGTNPNNPDTDNDGYNDKSEIISGYDPLTKDKKLPIDLKFSTSLKGKILLQVEGHNEAWYVNPKDGKRYFMGLPAEAVKVLEGALKVTTSTGTSV
jgi:Skp family chaperone for outer membrane proteins